MSIQLLNTAEYELPEVDIGDFDELVMNEVSANRGITISRNTTTTPFP